MSDVTEDVDHEALPRDLVRELTKSLHRTYPGWDGFDHSELVADEIDYKRQAVALTQELLGEAELRSLIEARDFDEVLNRVRQVAHKTNLLYLGTPSSGDLAVLHAEDLDEEPFSRALLDLLYGPGESPERLDRFSSFLDEAGLPNKWTLPTYLLFFRFPDTEMFVKPSVIRWFLGQIGAADLYGPRPDGAQYREILGHVRALRSQLDNLGVRDLVDVQSALWVGYRNAQSFEKLRPSEDKRQEIEKLFGEFTESFLTGSEGRDLLRSLQTERTDIRTTYQEILDARDGGEPEDLADRVFRDLLPTTRTPRGGSHEDARALYEVVGWRAPDDWADAAQAVLDLIGDCVDDPAKLSAICNSFSKLPWSAGLRQAALTPVLNALQPEELFRIDNEARRTINYLTGKSWGPRLADYPDINYATHVLLEDLADLLDSSAAQAGPTDVFYAFAQWLVAIRRFPFGDVKYWKIAPGEGAKLWDECRQGGFIAIGWNELGDLSSVSREDLEERWARQSKARDWTPEGIHQVRTFLREIQEGHRILANEGTRKIVGVGTVSGPYEYVPDTPCCHRLWVDWEDVQPREVDEPDWKRTIVSLDRDNFHRLLERPSKGEEEDPQSPQSKGVDLQPSYPLEDCAAGLRMSLDRLDRWVRAIQRKGQAIFYGPPGTGKTYVADHLARHLIGGGDGFMEIVQFHPSYAYEDFVQGIRPQGREDGGLDYPVKPGRFLELCHKAREREGRCVLVIDEINRANLSRVFGELMYLLEYRQESVHLAAGEEFSIPENVYLLGTMNTHRGCGGEPVAPLDSRSHPP